MSDTWSKSVKLTCLKCGITAGALENISSAHGLFRTPIGFLVQPIFHTVFSSLDSFHNFVKFSTRIDVTLCVSVDNGFDFFFVVGGYSGASVM